MMKNCTHTLFQTLLRWPAVRASLSPNVNIPPPRYCRQVNTTMQLSPLLNRAGYTQRQCCESEWCSLSHRVFLNVHISVTDIRNVSLFPSPFRSYTEVSLLLSSLFIFFKIFFNTYCRESEYRQKNKYCNRNCYWLIPPPSEKKGEKKKKKKKGIWLDQACRNQRGGNSWQRAQHADLQRALKGEHPTALGSQRRGR